MERRHPICTFRSTGTILNYYHYYLPCYTIVNLSLQMYITLGVGVGGHSFSDTIENKPYKNKDPKNQRIFYQMKDKWHATWNADSQLIVDYVKVYSI